MSESPIPPTATASVGATPAGGWSKPQPGFLFFLGFAAIGTAMTQLTPLVLTFPLKSKVVAEATGGALTDAAVLGIVLGLASIFGLLAYPIFGRLSDRVLWSGGRRRPFLFLAAIVIAISSVLQFVADSVPVLLLSAILSFIGGAAATVCFTSIIPDQIEPSKRGSASAIVGISLPVGALLGIFIAQFGSTLAWQIFVPIGIGVVGILLLAIVLKDKTITREQRPPLSFTTIVSTFWTNPVKNPSFAWAWWSRFLLFFAVAAIQAYQAFYLLDLLGVPGDDQSAVAGPLFLTTLALTVFVLIGAPIFAKISDKVGRRKPFVAVAAVVFAVGLIVAIVANSFPGFIVAMAIMGIGQGVYFAVDIALVSQILPDPDNPAKDLGIFGLAASLPNTVVIAVAPAIVAIGVATGSDDKNYSALFIAGAIAAVVGALFILPIRKVK